MQRRVIAAWALGGLAGLAWLIAARHGLSAARSADAASRTKPAIVAEVIESEVTASQARNLIESAQAARDRGELSEADVFFRQAWWSPAFRDVAARELRSLHADRDFKLPVDRRTLDAAHETLGGTFSVYETPRFVLLSDADPEWTRSRGALLERTHHQFFLAMDRLGYPAHPAPYKLQCILFEEHSDYREFAASYDGVDTSWVAGYYSGLSNRIVFYNDSTGPVYTEAFARLEQYGVELVEANDAELDARRRRDTAAARAYAARGQELREHIAERRKSLKAAARESATAKAVHEAAHLLSFNCGVQSRARVYPFWLTEGLAIAFETDDASSAFGPGFAYGARDEEAAGFMASGAPAPLMEFVSVDGVQGKPHRDIEDAYQQAHSLFSYLYKHERGALRLLLLGAIDTPASVPMDSGRLRRMFAVSFGNPDLLDARWRQGRAPIHSGSKIRLTINRVPVTAGADD